MGQTLWLWLFWMYCEMSECNCTPCTRFLINLCVKFDMVLHFSLFFPSLVPWSLGWWGTQRKERALSSERVRGRGKRQGGEWEGVWTRLLTDQWWERLHSHLEIHKLWDFHWFRTRPGALPAAADLPASQELQRRLAHFSPISPLFCKV